MSTQPLHVVSISLGSDRRDREVEVELLGRRIRIERRGTNGDLQRASELLAELDGKVDAFGLGGMDRYVYAAGKRYTVRDAERLVSVVKQTPVVDGSGLKHTLERHCIHHLDDSGALPIAGKQVLLVCGVDRFGMAEAFAELTDHLVIGDLMFALGLPFPIRTLRALHVIARAVLPVLVKLPLKWLYPTGGQQHDTTPKWGRHYAEADIIAGDFHFVRRYLPAPADPPPLAGKTVITNTTTEEDVELLRERGLESLVTTTPRYDGRSFGTNVLEAVFVAIRGEGCPLETDQLLELVEETGWKPTPEPVADRPSEEQTTL